MSDKWAKQPQHSLIIRHVYMFDICIIIPFYIIGKLFSLGYILLLILSYSSFYVTYSVRAATLKIVLHFWHEDTVLETSLSVINKHSLYRQAESKLTLFFNILLKISITRVYVIKPNHAVSWWFHLLVPSDKCVPCSAEVNEPIIIGFYSSINLPGARNPHFGIILNNVV